MTDIVQRLRLSSHWSVAREAAAEIEALRNELNGYKHDTRRLLEGEQHLQAEIKRLRSTLVLVADIAEGSTTPNSLPHIARVARELKQV